MVVNHFIGDQAKRGTKSFDNRNTIGPFTDSPSMRDRIEFAPACPENLFKVARSLVGNLAVIRAQLTHRKLGSTIHRER